MSMNAYTDSGKRHCNISTWGSATHRVSSPFLPSWFCTFSTPYICNEWHRLHSQSIYIYIYLSPLPPLHPCLKGAKHVLADGFDFRGNRSELWHLSQMNESGGQKEKSEMATVLRSHSSIHTMWSRSSSKSAMAPENVPKASSARATQDEGVLNTTN